MTITRMPKLNLGAGGFPLSGYENLDIKTGQTISDLSNFQSGSCGEIRASHVLEHVTREEARAAFSEWARVLPYGGKVRVAVPDMKAIFRRLVESDDPQKHDLTMRQAYGAGVDEHDRHLFGWTWETLTHALAAAGFSGFKPWIPDPDEQDCSSFEISLNIECVRFDLGTPPEEIEKNELRNPRLPDRYEISENPKVVVAITKPRLCFSEHEQNIMDLLNACELPDRVYGSGMAWEAGIEKCLELAAGTEGADYVLVLDYDSLFTVEDYKKMLAYMQAHPELTALYPVQANRHRETIMCNDRGFPVEPDIVETDYAHFGLTLIRTDALKRMLKAKPWFWAMPNPDTYRWETGKTDSDVYFWRKIRSFGGRLARCNRVQIGHIDQSVIWINWDGKRQFQPISDFTLHGMPEWAMR